MFSWMRRQLRGRRGGFTLIELVVVLAILSILIALAVPRYLSARKQAYRAEADDVLQETKSLEWAYYQQFNSFDTSGQSIGLVTPGRMHWNSPAISGAATSIEILMSGCGAACSPIATTDSVWVTLLSDGSSSTSSSF